MLVWSDQASWPKSAAYTTSVSFIPRVVTAGVPLGFIGLPVSKGMPFLLRVMPASSRAWEASG